jgi:hypothetical protein
LAETSWPPCDNCAADSIPKSTISHLDGDAERQMKVYKGATTPLHSFVLLLDHHRHSSRFPFT